MLLNKLKTDAQHDREARDTMIRASMLREARARWLAADKEKAEQGEERRSKAQARSKRNGLQRANRYGYRYPLVDCREEQAIMEEAVVRQRDGFAMDGLAARLNREGKMARNGNQWTGVTIRERMKVYQPHAAGELRTGSGQPPFGYRYGEPVPHEPEQAAIRRAVELHDAGNTWERVAEILNREGYKSSHGKPWGKASARHVAVNNLRETAATSPANTPTIVPPDVPVLPIPDPDLATFYECRREGGAWVVEQEHGGMLWTLARGRSLPKLLAGLAA